jgi:2-iminobutanoate/2-iminopropanoate deaminase
VTKEVLLPGGDAIPISQVVSAGGLMFISGQVAEDPATGEPSGGNTAAQTRQVLVNLAAVLEAVGGSLSDVVKVTAYLIDIDDFDQFNEVYRTFFASDPPARATVEVTRLAGPFSVEIEAVAALHAPSS